MPPIIPVLKLQLVGEIQSQLGNLALPPQQRIARHLPAYLCRSDPPQEINQLIDD